MTTTLLSALLAALAAWLATPPPSASRRLTALTRTTSPTEIPAPGADSAGAGAFASGTGAIAGGRAGGTGAIAGGRARGTAAMADGRAGRTRAMAGGRPGGAGGGVLGVVLTWLGRCSWWRSGARRRRDGAVWAEASVELCQSMAAELRAGRTPGDALQAAVEVLPEGVRAGLRGVTAAAATGGDVPAELTAVARREPGAAGLAQAAAAWRVGAGSGGGLADVLEQVAQSLRDEQAHRAQVSAQLAGPRATARLLAALPLLGLGLASGSGAHPLDFLFGTPAGIACLIVGLALDALGLWWSTRIAATALETDAR
ncbi:MAG: pilus assembly protein TadB [Streptosporangiales bacterium]|nr:pilus assembly protein TadB [Streptosporangiales bacterium]